MPGSDNDVIYGGNIDLSGGAVPAAQMIADGQLLIGATGLNPGVSVLTSGDGSTTITSGPGTIGLTTTQATTTQLGGAELATDDETKLGTDTQRTVTPSGLNSFMNDLGFTGRLEWGGAGVYYSVVGTDFTLERQGSGYIRSQLIEWTGGQSTGALAVGFTYYIYIDDTGTIGTATTRSLALFQGNIVLFEVLVDPNSMVTVVREDHPYDFPMAISEWAHDTIGTVIANLHGGANIALNGTKAIQIDGADDLEDHGLETEIPDSGAAAVDFTFMFTNGAGKWEIDSTANTFNSEYNNGGVVAALGANKYGIFRLYVSKDDLNTATPVYYAVLDDAQYNNLTLAQTAIALGTPPTATNEFAQLEMAQLGFVIKEESSDNIVDVIIEKETARTTFSGATSNVASLITTDTTNFNGWLGAGDTTVQAALETLDDVGLGVTPQHSVLLGDAALGITSTGVLTDGQLLIGSTGLAPAVASLVSGDASITITPGAGTIDLAAAGGGMENLGPVGDALQGGFYWPQLFFYRRSESASSATVGTADRIYAHNMPTNGETTVTQLGVEIVTPQVGGEIRWGLYTDDDGQPGVRIFESGIVDASAAAIVWEAVGMTIPAGNLWVLYTANMTNIAVRTYGGDGNIIIYDANGPTFYTVIYDNRGSFAELPNPYSPVSVTLSKSNKPLLVLYQTA